MSGNQNHMVVNSKGVAEYYATLHTLCGDIISQSTEVHHQTALAEADAFVVDMDKWLIAISHRREMPLMRFALEMYQFALLAAVEGMYALAFMGVRLFLEHALWAVWGSADEFGLRTWLRGDRDVSWRTIMDEESGVFSRRFIRAFCEPLTDNGGTYAKAAAKLYRQCSGYVHASADVQSKLPDTLSYDEEAFNLFLLSAKKAREVVVFALSVRYIEDFDDDVKADLEQVVLDELGHISEIRAHYGATVEE